MDSVSLVICTIGDRVIELNRLLNTLVESEHCKFECIVVDQNKDNRVYNVLKLFQHRIDITRKESTPGLSKSRNVGISTAKSAIIGFPDDDCWFMKDTLAMVNKFFACNPNIDLLSGRIVDQDGYPCLHRNWPLIVREICYSDTMLFVASAALFIRRSAFENVGLFDVDMGVGSRFGSCEEIELVRRILRAGGRGVYDPKIVVGHPNVGTGNDPASIGRARKHGQGVGYLLAKERAGASQVFRWVMRPLLGSILSAVRGRAIESRMRVSLGRGRLEGWMEGRRYLREKQEQAGTGVSK